MILIEWGYLLAFVLGVIVAMGTVLLYFKKVRTERKLVEEELRESEERYRQVVEFSPEPIFIQSEGKCVFANPATAKLVGVTKPEELYGKVILDCVHPDYHRVVTSRIAELQCGNPVPVIEIQIVRTDGAVIDVEVSSTAFVYYKKAAALVLIRDISERKRVGEPIRKISHTAGQSPTMVEDITYRKREEQELHKARAETEAANHSKTQFLANISHEIRTVMNCINGMTELLFTTEITPAQKEYLELIKSSSATLLNLINDILDLARIEGGKIRLEQTRFDVRAIHEQIIKSYQLQAQQKGLQFDYSIAPEVPAYLNGDPHRLRQVLGNLLANAIKFTDKGGVSLRIEVQKESSIAIHILFVVSDTGIGIRLDKIDLLFKNFSQVDNSNTSKYSGSGLGLAICKQLVELMNGRIWVESEPGLGSQFSFMVPFLKSKTGNVLEIARSQPSGLPDKKFEDIGRKIKVLVVEDHPVNQRFVSLLLQKIGGEVTLASSGIKALEVLETTKFDLILMDVQMPEMDGYETTVRIREKERLTNTHTPIIALTAFARWGDKVQCLAAGMDSYLSKPISAAKLYSLVTHTLENKLNQDGFSQPPPIDLTATLRIVDGDFQLVGELVSSFKNDCPLRLAELVKIHQEGDFGKLEHLTHRLKGSISYFGAEKALTLIEKLQQLCRSKQFEAATAVLKELETELGRIIDFISQFERGNIDEGFNC